MISATIHELTSSHSILVPCSVEVPTRKVFFAAISALNTLAALQEEYGKYLLSELLPKPKQGSYLASVLVKEATEVAAQIKPLSSSKVLVYTSFPEYFAYLLFLGYLHVVATKATQEMVLEDFRDISFFSGTYPIRFANWAENAQAYGRIANDAAQAMQLGRHTGVYGVIRDSMVAYSENFGIGRVPISKAMLAIPESQYMPSMYISSATHFVPASYARTARDDALTGLFVDLDAPLYLNHTEACSLNLQVSLTLGNTSTGQPTAILSADGTGYTYQHTPFSHCWSFPKISVDAQLSKVNMVGNSVPPSFVSGDTNLLTFFGNADSWHADSIGLFDGRTDSPHGFRLSPTIIGLADTSSIL